MNAFTLAVGLALLGPAGVEAPPTDTPPPASVPPRVEPEPRDPGGPVPPDFDTFAGDPIGVKRVVLGNGLTVLLSENHERPEVFGAVVVRTGGKNDPPDNTGMAHYLEHMLFKGTRSLGTSDWAREKPLQDEIVRLYDELAGVDDPEQRAALQEKISDTVRQTYRYAIPNELDTLLAELGGEGVNAFTNEDETVYHNSFPASQVEAWLAIYGHRFQNPVFRLFPTELEAVYEEKNISMDRFEVKLYETFMRRAFPEHPYGTQTVIGEVEHLKRPSLSAMRRYFERYYVPGNMALVLAGDFDAARVIPVIEREFGGWKSGPVPEQATGTVEPFSGRELLKVRMTPVRAGALGYRTVPEKHPDHAALMVVRELLSNDQGSGFLDQLMDDGKLLIVFPFPADFADQGLELVFYAPRILGQSFSSAEKLVRRQYERIAAGEFPDESFAAAKKSLLILEEGRWESNEERALAMGRSFTSRGGWDAYLAHLDRLRALTKQDVMRAASTYFGNDYLQMRSRMGFPKKEKLQKPHYPPVKPLPGAESAFAHRIRERPLSPPEIGFIDPVEDLARVEVAPGVVLYANPNPHNDRYTLELRFGAGLEHIRELDVLQEYLGEVGAGKRKAAAVKQRLARLNTTIDFHVTLERFVVTVDGPEENLTAALEVVRDLMAAPASDPKALRRLRRQRWGMRRVSLRDPGYVAAALFQHALYGDRSSYLRSYGPRSMRKLSPEELLAAWDRVQGHAVEARYVGRQKPAEVAARLGDTLPFRAELRPAEDVVVYDRRSPEEPTVYFVPRKDAIQTHIYFAAEGDPIPEGERAGADAFREYLGGGMGGLVFQEIREFRALAYSTWGNWFTDRRPDQRGWFGGYVGCQADKTFEAAEVMLDLIQRLPRKPERMDAVRKALMRSMETRSPGFRELQDQLEEWRWLGYERDPRRERLAAYEKIEFADIESFYAAHLEGRPVTLMVVGDPRRVNVDRLAEYGRVVKVREKKLFSP